MMVYPFGTPLLFAYILWYNREQLQSIRDGDHAVTNGLTATVPDNKIPLALKLVRFIKPLEPTKSAEGSVMEGRAKLAKGVMVKADKDQEPGRTGLAPEVRALTNDYRLDCYWWELVECLRKVLLTGLFMFYKKGSLEQLALGLLVCLFFIQAYHNVKPYARNADNMLQQLCQLSIFVTLLTGLARYDLNDCNGGLECEEAGNSTVNAVLITCELTPLAIILIQCVVEVELLQETIANLCSRCLAGYREAVQRVRRLRGKDTMMLPELELPEATCGCACGKHAHVSTESTDGDLRIESDTPSGV